ncbi:MAG TPA: glycoside hydrolase family 3 N-terminal domain-containing protein, partial [Nitrospiria bacterium]|nr:glycoside hydrolase family 3 N-terminal domain-containing protein [Nitrospiria bacterium]
MNLREKLAQLIMVGFEGAKPGPAITRLVKTTRVGGVILFRRNVETPAQVASLTRRLQR